MLFNNHQRKYSVQHTLIKQERISGILPAENPLFTKKALISMRHHPIISQFPDQENNCRLKEKSGQRQRMV
jgi:hypothetical protein